MYVVPASKHQIKQVANEIRYNHINLSDRTTSEEKAVAKQFTLIGSLGIRSYLWEANAQ